jgi:methyl-accepting chemotaxis protein
LLPDILRTEQLIQQIAQSSREQETGVDQINSAIMALDQVIQQNAAAAEEMAAGAEELSGQSEQMQSLVAGFKIEQTLESAVANQNPQLQLISGAA